MKITVQGLQLHHEWFARRLASHGLEMVSGDLPPMLLTEPSLQGWCGLLADRTLIDTGTSGLLQRQTLSTLCRQHGFGYAELGGDWQAEGIEFGFPLFIGASQDAREQLKPLFDALAPAKGMWLYCGPAAAGHFTAGVFAAMTHAWLQAMPGNVPVPGQTPQAIDWNAFFIRQHSLANQLLAFSRHYLALYPQNDDTDVWQQLDSFRQPPMLQSHFAANLARLIVLALGQNQALQQIFEQILGGAANAGAPHPAAAPK